ncbi:hypothetical protein [Sphingomonas endolithica]|uniref:hypothetical protein n=1 Tax=Sphingomonas endolithica TaxID=2972485 RepID=UPI0021B022F6|nr:hypothetical protein [Sphingomonas sp. ZFBP2030]
MTDIPPPRYKIVERKGRIVVTDTWAEGGRPGLPPSPPPGGKRNPSLVPAGTHAAIVRSRDILVALACGTREDSGRPVVTTSVHIDEKGPRSIALSDAGAARLGNWMIAALALCAFVLILFAVSFVPAMLLLGGIGLALSSANTTARPAITRWLDTLGETIPR